jgi:DNA modification methylase
VKEFTCKHCAKKFKANPVEKPAEHRLLVGDSTDKASVEVAMGGGKAGLFSTDPPYVVNYTGADHPRSKSNINKKGQVRQIDWSDTYHEQDIDGDGSKFYDHFITVVTRPCKMT